MTLRIEWTENKSKDWKICTVTKPDGTTTENVSVNRMNKKGEVFPNFDGIAPGADIEGELWRSDAGKWYLFAPKPKGEGLGTRPAWVKPKADMTRVMEKKQESIEKNMDVKNEAIKMAGAQRDAVLMVTTFYATQALSEEELQAKVEYWYQYFINRLSQPF